MRQDLKDIYIKQLKNIFDELKERIERKLPFDEFIASKTITRISAAISRIAGGDSEYYKSLEKVIIKYDTYPNDILSILGVAEALLKDIEEGYLKTLTQLVHDDIFSDFLEMADYLLDEGFKDASAVIAGSTLEEHLRKLCLKNNIGVTFISSGKDKPKQASKMNQELYSKKTIKKGDMMQITAWLDIRNNAAHGKYNEYSKDKVELMILGIRAFISNYPA